MGSSSVFHLFINHLYSYGSKAGRAFLFIFWLSMFWSFFFCSCDNHLRDMLYSSGGGVGWSGLGICIYTCLLLRNLIFNCTLYYTEGQKHNRELGCWPFFACQIIVALSRPAFGVILKIHWNSKTLVMLVILQPKTLKCSRGLRSGILMHLSDSASVDNEQTLRLVAFRNCFGEALVSRHAVLSYNPWKVGQIAKLKTVWNLSSAPMPFMQRLRRCCSTFQFSYWTLWEMSQTKFGSLGVLFEAHSLLVVVFHQREDKSIFGFRSWDCLNPIGFGLGTDLGRLSTHQTLRSLKKSSLEFAVCNTMTSWLSKVLWFGFNPCWCMLMLVFFCRPFNGLQSYMLDAKRRALHVELLECWLEVWISLNVVCDNHLET